MKPFAPRFRTRPSAEKANLLNDVQGLAILALAFLGETQDRSGAFLQATGLPPESLRAAAREPAFARAVLCYLAEDERLLRDFASHHQIDIADLGRAIAASRGDTG